MPPDNHKNDGNDVKLRNRMCDKGCNQACNLAEQDNVQAVRGSRLSVHAEEIIQYHQIDGSAADLQKAGHYSQYQTDDHAGELVGYFLGFNGSPY